MPAAGRRCRQPVRHSVHLSGPRRRRRLLSPDARGQPRAARSSSGPARRRAPPPPGPAPALFPVCPSVRQSTRPLALPSSCPAASPQPVSPLCPLCLSPARCLFVSALALPRSPSLVPHLGSPQRAPLVPRSLPFWAPPHLWGSFRTPSTPPGLPFELPVYPLGALPSAPPDPGRLASS